MMLKCLEETKMNLLKNLCEVYKVLKREWEGYKRWQKEREEKELVELIKKATSKARHNIENSPRWKRIIEEHKTFCRNQEEKKRKLENAKALVEKLRERRQQRRD
ncbi:hypothetical protein ACFL29_02510 [Patescibacteria group bacterium]